MKKLFTIDDFMVALIAALGYGFGETIASLSGWSVLMCTVACFALGMASEEIISKIVFSKAVQNNPRIKVFTFTAIILVFLAGQYISIRWMGVSMLEYLQEEFAFVVVLPVLGFIVNLLIRLYQIRKIRSRYEDGGEGFVFDLKKEDIEETNRQNQPITGEYDTDCAVKTKNGIYVGEKYGKFVAYLGIPYAKPPVGGLRWKAPEPLPASDAVFEAKNMGASAIQVEHSGSIVKHHRQSEDCLTLNIGVGGEKTETLKPVLVLFHHGDLTFGGSADPLLYGGNFGEKHPDTVFVSFNFRLGIFGFIDFSEIPGGESCPDTLNLGLLDQIAALKWIKENIKAFGGDPERITVMGSEAGATSIFMLAVSDEAKGLFQRAIIVSGSPAYVYNTPEASRALTKSLLKETRTETMEELMALDTDTLKDASQRLWKNMCAPVCDGKLIPENVYQALKDGKASGIEFIIAITSDETDVYRSFIGNEKCIGEISSTMADIRSCLNDTGLSAVQTYLEAQTASSSELEAQMELLEQWLALSIYRAAVRLNEAGNRVHLIYWDEAPLIENLGSGTVDVTAALLGNDEALRMYGNVLDKDLSEILQTLLHKFLNGESLKLYTNEIKGVDAFDWKKFPRALIVSDGKLQCDKIEDRITEIKELLNDDAYKS